MVHGLHEVCISYVYHKHKLKEFVSKSMCIHLLGDSNTKCTHLGGVHPMACDFETNIFTSLSFVVSRGVNTLREGFSRSSALCLKTFNWLQVTFKLVHAR